MDARGVIGYLANPKRFNVAITRAQAGLFVCGNASCLALDPLWRKLMEYIKENGGWAGSPWEDEASLEDEFNESPAEELESCDSEGGQSDGANDADQGK